MVAFLSCDFHHRIFDCGGFLCVENVLMSSAAKVRLGETDDHIDHLAEKLERPSECRSNQFKHFLFPLTCDFQFADASWSLRLKRGKK